MPHPLRVFASVMGASAFALMTLLHAPTPIPVPEAGSAVRIPPVPAPTASERHRQERLGRPDVSDEVSLFAVGDLMPGRGVARMKARHPEGWLLEGVAAAVRAADVAVVNLEAPIAEGPPVPDESMRLRADPGIEREIAAAGFDLVTLANNHALDAGTAGLRSTRGLLSAAGLRHAGSGEDEAEARSAVLLERNGVRMTFLSYADPAFTRAGDRALPQRPGIAFMDAGTVASDIDAASSSDVTVVLMHAGTEYSAGSDAAQRRFARAAIDAGADLVIGHHPHVVQPVETYRGKPIIYSLGNFVFDQGWSEATSLGLAADIRLGREGVRRIHWLPLGIASGRPSFLEGKRASDVIARLGTEAKPAPAFRSGPDGPVPVTAFRTPFAPVRDGNIMTLREADLDGDGEPERVSLARGRVRVVSRGTEAWVSPEDWWVDGLLLDDLTHDGLPDLTLSAWMDEEGAEMSNRTVLHRYRDRKAEAVWSSSGQEAPKCALSASDLDGDGRMELLASEGSFSGGGCMPSRMAAWRWHGDGFTNLWRQEVPDLTGFDAVAGSVVPR